MKLQAFRIVKARLAKDAFTGEGARLYGGRWNTPGTPMIYAASSTSLAMLEMLVHLQSRDLMAAYALFTVEFESSLVTEVDTDALPGDWSSSPVPLEVQQIGDEWAASQSSAVLRVPSATVPDDSNFLLNLRHARFEEIEIGMSRPIKFDPRLK